jgi:hypothetical protein
MKDRDILKYKNGKYLKGILDYDDEHNCVHEFLFEEGDWFCALGSPNNLSVNVFQLGVNELDQEIYYLIVGGMTSDKVLQIDGFGEMLSYLKEYASLFDLSANSDMLMFKDEEHELFHGSEE